MASCPERSLRGSSGTPEQDDGHFAANSSAFRPAAEQVEFRRCAWYHGDELQSQILD